MYVSPYQAVKLYYKERQRETETYRTHRDLVLQATRSESTSRQDNPLRRVMNQIRVEMQKHRGVSDVRPAHAI
jgi:hypothetical protein